jgi:hypothetical protein
MMKTLVVILVWNRFDNLKRWLYCWDQCEKDEAELIVIHNLENDNQKYDRICDDYGVRIVNRPNVGFDIGAFQDVCKERLRGFPNDWDNLIWFTDDCIPMKKDFVTRYLEMFKRGIYPCYEISELIKLHLRTTGFFITKSMSKRLVWPSDPIVNRDSCYEFEHRGFNLLQQMQRMGITPVMVSGHLEKSPVWDTGCRDYLQLWAQHERVFARPS